MVTITADARPFLRGIDDMAKRQIPFATALALTDVARAAQKEVKRELPSIFDKPTPFTMNAVGIQAATKNRLEARVFVKDRQAGYLSVQETGGTRLPKKVALILPRAVQRNAYGNLAYGALKRLNGRKDVFVGAPKGGAGGFYKRMAGGKLKQLVAFTPHAKYQPRFAFQARVIKAAMAAWPAAFREGMAKAMATAKKP